MEVQRVGEKQVAYFSLSMHNNAMGQMVCLGYAPTPVAAVLTGRCTCLDKGNGRHTSRPLFSTEKRSASEAITQFQTIHARRPSNVTCKAERVLQCIIVVRVLLIKQITYKDCGI